MMKKAHVNLIKLIDLLGDGQYHDGTSIGEKLHITRAAVWKMIKKLEQYEVPLESIKGKGYRLTAPMILLNPEEIQASLTRSNTGLIVLEKTESTNDYVKHHDCLESSALVCMAETQTAGRGRLQRTWHSPFGENIYLSLKCVIDRDVSALSGLSLVMSLAICHAIETTLEIEHGRLQVKWPNDVYLDGLKLSGSLIEIQAETHGACQVIVGVGMNVNMHKATKRSIQQPWTSLRISLNQYIDRNPLSAVLIDALLDYFEKFNLHGLTVFRDEWKGRDFLRNKAIQIQVGQHQYTGQYAGINDQGLLLIDTKDKGIVTCSSGDATLN